LRLFGTGGGGPAWKSGPDSRPLDPETRVSHEVETLGFPLSVHPLRRYGKMLDRTPRCLAKDLRSRLGRIVTLAGWPVAGKTVLSLRGEPMKFVSFEDETGLYETVFFPREYGRFCHMLGKSRAYLIRGRVEEDLGAVTVAVSRVVFLDSPGPDRGFKRLSPPPGGPPGPPGRTRDPGTARFSPGRTSGSAPGQGPLGSP
jgi:DNA polymerase III alpha subunit